MNWKALVYESYVSSGHVVDNGTPERQFKGRQAYLGRLIEEHFPANREARIIDIGCGHGALIHFLRKAGYRNVAGVDGSEEQVNLAERLGIQGVKLGNAMEFLLSCAPAGTDVVCLFDVIEHLDRQEAFELLAEVRRVLPAEGLCIGHAPNAEGIFGARIRYGDLTHENAFTPSSISQMFRSLKFRDVKCFEDKPVVHGAKSLARRVLWWAGTLPARVLLMAETGTRHFVLSQNLLFVARR